MYDSGNLFGEEMKMIQQPDITAKVKSFARLYSSIETIDDCGS